MEFILDDQIGGLKPLGQQPTGLITTVAGSKESLAWLSVRHAAEELPGCSHPGQGSELVDCGDHEGW